MPVEKRVICDNTRASSFRLLHGSIHAHVSAEGFAHRSLHGSPKTLTGNISEFVDVRVLEVIYRFDPLSLSVMPVNRRMSSFRR